LRGGGKTDKRRRSKKIGKQHEALIVNFKEEGRGESKSGVACASANGKITYQGGDGGRS